MVMQRALSQRAVGQMARVHSLLIGLTAGQPPLAACWCGARQPPVSQQSYLGTSASSKTVEKPKHILPAEDEQTKKSSLPPHCQAGTGEDSSTKSPGASSTIPQEETEMETDPLQDKSIGLVQRFKKTFKQYGKVMIPVHLLTSSVWFGTFYYAALK